MTLSYDVENRMTYANTTSSAMKYAYDGQNKRMFSCPYDATQGVCAPTQTFYFYGPNGKLLSTFNPQYTAAYMCSNQICPPTLTMSSPGIRQYFGSRLLGNEDRLGSRGRYYPYGEDRGSNPGDGSVTFATYTRDSATGLNYADQRYYAAGWGRFIIPDRYRPSARPALPQSWNRYEYVDGDPVNANDPTGLVERAPDPDCDLEDPNPFCEPSWDPPPPPPPPPDENPTNCEIEVFNRPIEATHGANIPGAQHGYILFVDPSGDAYVFEGKKDGYTLTAVDTSSDPSLVPALAKDDPSHDHLDGRHIGPEVCDWLTILQQDASEVNAASIHYHWYGPNSNSVLRYLLESLPNQNWYKMPLMIGYNSLLPGIETP